MNTNTTDFARLVSEFLTNYLPLQRNYSKNTILSYRDALKLLVVFITDEKGIRMTEFTSASRVKLHSIYLSAFGEG
jgi:site-specific recombinase XerD